MEYSEPDSSGVPINDGTVSLGYHPPEQALRRYASEDLGHRRRKLVGQHLEDCIGCRQTVTHFRTVFRRFRDFERSAIAQWPNGPRGNW